MNISELTHKVLNEPGGLRTSLMATFPEVSKLEQFDGFKDLRLTQFKTDPILILGYDAIAELSTYYGLRENLIRAGITTGGNSNFMRAENKGKYNEFTRVHIVSRGAELQFFLNVYTPEYNLES